MLEPVGASTSAAASRPRPLTDPAAAAQRVKQLALECGFQLVGIAEAKPLPEAYFYFWWIRQGMAGEMRYLTDQRAELRADPRSLLPQARSIICVGLLYHTPFPLSTQLSDRQRGWISRYAWGRDYHKILRRRLRDLAKRLELEFGKFHWKLGVDAIPFLERAYARRAGLGWIGRNTCLINQRLGSWFFLGELLTSLELEPDAPPPDRCGSCRRCIDSCPTAALIPNPGPEGPSVFLDARRCISYLTIEHRSSIPEGVRTLMGNHVFGCDICQDVCPWNRKAPVTPETEFTPRWFAPPLEELASLNLEAFERHFAGTPVRRAGYEGFLRNVTIAIANSGVRRLRSVLAQLAHSASRLVADHARWALGRG